MHVALIVASDASLRWLRLILHIVGASARAAQTLLKLLLLIGAHLRLLMIEVVVGEPDRRRLAVVVRISHLRVLVHRVLRATHAVL